MIIVTAGPMKIKFYDVGLDGRGYHLSADGKELQINRTIGDWTGNDFIVSTTPMSVELVKFTKEPQK